MARPRLLDLFCGAGGAARIFALWRRAGQLWRHLMPAGRRPTASAVHEGATEDYADLLHHTGELPVCDELTTQLEWELQLHRTLTAVEEQLRAGLDDAYGRFLTALGLDEGDLIERPGFAGMRKLVAA